MFPHRRATSARFRIRTCLVPLLCLLSIAGCKTAGKETEAAYVSASQAALRDHVAAVYAKVGILQNGERVEVLERSKRFARVRTARGEEGWTEQRNLVSQEVFEGFQKLAAENARLPVQARGSARAELNMHLTPERDAEHLYQLKEGEKVELLERGSSERPGAKISAIEAEAAGKPAPAPPMEDWWLARDARGRAGWVLARMIDLDVALEVAQYAEGKRIVADFVLNQVKDGDKKVPQYLLLFNEPKDGMPFDFNQARVFTWNTRRHRYETAYREHKLEGFLPARVGRENFGKEGTLPVFVLRLRDPQGNIGERKYKINGVMVRRVK